MKCYGVNWITAYLSPSLLSPKGFEILRYDSSIRTHRKHGRTHIAYITSITTPYYVWHSAHTGTICAIQYAEDKTRHERIGGL